MVRSGALNSEFSNLCYYQLKYQHPNFCAIFSKSNPDAHVSAKINTFTLQGGSGGNIAPLEAKELIAM